MWFLLLKVKEEIADTDGEDLYDCIWDAEEEDLENTYPLNKINKTTTTSSFLIQGGSSCCQNYQEKNQDLFVDLK